MAKFTTKTNPKYFHKSQLKFYFILTPIAVFMMLPIIFIFSQAFKPLDELFLYPPRFFVRKPTLANFYDLFSLTRGSTIPISRYLMNSILTAFFTVLFTIIISVFAGYALSKKQFKAKSLIFTINNLALMFVPIAVIIPRYYMVQSLGLIDTFIINILSLLAMPIGVFLIKQFMDQIPDALIDAALVDGANDFQIIFNIIIPLLKPAISTVGILAFQVAWNSAEASTYYINNENLRTFAFYVSNLTQTTGNTIAGQGIAAAAGLIMFVPNLLLFIIMQSRVMNTMAYSGLK
ncbi:MULTISPECIES: carbohydrate ABC transporter permease [Fervidobacterium]|uniref:Binding-protein-dependent transport systems inner membrane component n=1 Tax=Fervidobacterium nodosum (strain ATCC 35602 / DSM 5306 / Rt17-B1) TaxID=381764 RepID=A7HJS5_FERNB|nr:MULTISPECIES: carbohydrate ABC transporter permease [Fervidobacterium]ABS60158.1 binding-protein-dependent transport systems inner membrane component [Fervidobacterium nodosum Rt17-B1]KAF2961756.1 ABC transporter permease [Fervidobacterium sp. 2310opik-2]PHJ13865.1 ABC transporter permease [Fervidobacterium sp. SC_NGM5_G05]HOJ94176.1 carbohydrate ABC transporter permease [Fervidobacterium nodosum]